MKPCILFLSCANADEADKISDALLTKKLIVCAKRSPIHSSFLWHGEKDQADEVLLIMDSIEENFKKIEREVRKLHSYETFVLFSIPISQTTNDVKKWFKNEIHG